MNDTTPAPGSQPGRHAGSHPGSHPGAFGGRRRIGVISDTHGRSPAALVDRFQGVDLIVHAGDVGNASILRDLGRIAPVHAVMGNCDTGEPSLSHLQSTEMVDLGGALAYVLHDLSRLDLTPAAAGVSVVVSGHTHKALIARQGGVVYLNPGSAWRARDGNGPSVAILTIDGGRIEAKILRL